MKNTKLIKVCSERYLPAELWTGILSRLPVKSLLRFRCVSTSWLSMIDDAEFARLHLKNFKNNADETHLLIVDDGRRDGQLKYNVCCSDTFEITSETRLSIEGSWRFVCSVHGLVLLEIFFEIKASRLRKLKVWNPSIRKFHEFASLPEIEIPPNSHFKDVDIGLGYDPVANAYKYGELMFVDRNLPSVAVYSLGTGSWKMLPFRGEGCSWHWDPNTIGCKRSVYSGGNLYFMARDSGNRRWELVSYDLSSEVFSSVSLPDDPFFRHPGFGWYSEILLTDGGCSVAVLDIKEIHVGVGKLRRWTRVHALDKTLLVSFELS